MGGPVGAVVGGVVGGMVASSLALTLVDKLTRTIFDLPKDEVVEAAYNFFELSHRCSNSGVNTAYRQMCLRHHPDKGGKREEFFEVQVHMASIKMSRGEM